MQDIAVTLRAISEADYQNIVTAFLDETLVTQLTALSLPVTEQQCQDYFEFLHDDDVVTRVILVNGNFVGLVSLSAELTFWLIGPYQKKGVATYAVTEFLNLPEVGTVDTSIVACCLAENDGAQRLLKNLRFELTKDDMRRFSFALEKTVHFMRFERPSR